MLVMIDGVAEVECMNGRKVGYLAAGASFNEVLALGLFGTRTATIRAVETCRVLAVTASALQRALNKEENTEAQVAFDELQRSRKQQVEEGLPITALPIVCSADDLCAQAIALQAERLELESGALCEMLSSHDPCGIHFLILASGDAVLESVFNRGDDSSDAKPWEVMTLGAGALVPEALAAFYSSRIRATTACVAYRVRQFDFLLAIESCPVGFQWLPHFRMVESEFHTKLLSRLQAGKGVALGLQPHPSDPDIQDWGSRRVTAIGRARKKKTAVLKDFQSILPAYMYGGFLDALPIVPPGFVDSRPSSRGSSREFGSTMASTLRRDASAPELRDTRKQRLRQAGDSGRTQLPQIAPRARAC
jgi:CRP-like cAMP-binding protein